MSPTAAIAIAGVAGLTLGGVIAAWPGRVGAGFATQAAGVALLGASGASVLVGGDAVGAGFRSGIAPALGLDPLSGFFVLVLAVTAVPAL
ncbi:MAG TPA: hypothetical protein VNR42_06725, partial [Solirubrobacteraceae bacterium]|nr:hypothetical protein [Solirubrobacteraceae bacterium]